MRNRGLWPILAAATAAAALPFAWRAVANNAMMAAPVPPNVAVVNLESVINNLEELQTRQSELTSYRDQLVKKVGELETSADTLTSQLKVLPQNAPEFRKAQEDLARKQFEIRFERELAEELMARRRGDIQRELFNKVAEASRRLAQQRGFQLVLSNDSVVDILEGPESQVVRQVASRRIIYADQTLDISGELVAMMNNEWRAAAKPAGGVQPGGQGGR